MAQYLESGQVVVHLRPFSRSMEAVASPFLTTINDTLVMATSQYILIVIFRRKEPKPLQKQENRPETFIWRPLRTFTNRRPACERGGDVPSPGCRSRASRTTCGWSCGFRPGISSRSPPLRRV